MAFTLITVTCTYRTADGNAASGTVKFTPSNPMVNGVMTVASPIQMALDRLGKLSITVAANDDPATTPTGSYYTVTEALSGQTPRTYNVIIPYAASGGTVDLSTLTTIAGPSGGSSGGSAVDPTAVHRAGTETITGVKTFTASPLVPTPTTASQAAPKSYVDSVAGSGGGGGSTPATMLHRILQTSAGTYPTRPTPGYVDWLGTVDPGPLPFGDTWTQLPATAPDAPTIGTATAGAAQASVAFTAPVWNGGQTITGYTATSTPGSLTATGTTSPLTVTGLTNGTSYTFKVKATNATGAGPESAASNSVVPTSGGGATLPGAPTIGTATGGDGQATVAFTAPASNGGSAITSYTATSTPGGLTGTGSSSPVTVAGLTNATAYTFKVAATNGVGTGPQSAASNSVTPAGSASALTDLFTGADGDPWSSTVWKTPPGSPNIFANGWTIQNNRGRIAGTSAGSFEATHRRFNMTNAANWRIRCHLVTPPSVTGWNFHLVLQATNWPDQHLPNTGYVVFGSSAGYAFIKYVGDAPTTLQSTTTLAATDRWLDVKVVGGVLSYKAWTGVIGDAPGSFTTVTNPTPLTGTGEAGIFFGANGGIAGLTQIDIDDVLVDNNPS